MTATAPSRVRRDILNHLHTSEGQTEHTMRIIAGDVTRPNLRFEVFHARNKDQKLHRLLAFCQAELGSGIVYDSKQTAEFRETLDKAKSFMKILR